MHLQSSIYQSIEPHTYFWVSMRGVLYDTRHVTKYESVFPIKNFISIARAYWKRIDIWTVCVIKATLSYLPTCLFSSLWLIEKRVNIIFRISSVTIYISNDLLWWINDQNLKIQNKYIKVPFSLQIY